MAPALTPIPRKAMKMLRLLDRERFGSGFLPNWVQFEHAARWRFASGYVYDKYVVDCACGLGEGTYLFADSGARRVYAFDLSESAVETTRIRCANFPTVQVSQTSGVSLPLPNSSIDVFISLETIEHVEEDVEYLQEITRVLKAEGGGIFICSTPNRDITMPGKSLRDRPWNPFHVREYDKTEFLTLLYCGFNNIKLYGQNPKKEWRVKLLKTLGAALPGHAGGRINSAMKLHRLFNNASSAKENHIVIEYPTNGDCEYLVAVCSSPKK